MNAPATTTKFLGLFKRQERWGLSRRGWLFLLVLAVTAFLISLFGLCPFLSTSQPVPSRVLAVDGWMADYALEQALREFKAHGYEMLIVTGPPLLKGYHLSEYKSFAHIGAATLLKLGLDEKTLAVVPSPDTRKDRTYLAALNVKTWLRTHRPAETSLNVLTVGPHARRTRLLYEKALGSQFTVGVIAAEDRDYDTRAWWKSSQGFRTVTGELIAYAYARLWVWLPRQPD